MSYNEDSPKANDAEGTKEDFPWPVSIEDMRYYITQELVRKMIKIMG